MIFTDVSCSLQLNTFNKYVVIAASVAGLSGVTATAYFCRRKLKRHSSEFLRNEDLSKRSCSGTTQKRRKLFYPENNIGIVLDEWEDETVSNKDDICFNSSLKMGKAFTLFSEERKPALGREIRSSNFSLELLTMSCIKDTREVPSKVNKTKVAVVPSSASQLLDENKQSFNKFKPTTDFKSSADFIQSVKSELPGKVKDFQNSNLKMYEKALELAIKGEIKCRKIRTWMKFVHSERDFLAKVHCLRQGFEVMLRDENVGNWLAETFGSIVARILRTTNNIEYFQSVDFNEAYIDLLIFLFIGNQNSIIKDLRFQGITHLSFYDIVLCFILMDMFDHIEDLSKTIKFPKNNIHLTERLQVNPIVFASQDVYRTRQQYAYDANGFLVRVYRVCSYLAPALAIGLQGPNSYLQKACLSFEKETKDYIECLFNFDKVRYTTPTEMAEDLWSLTKERLTHLHEKLIEELKHIDDAEN